MSGLWMRKQKAACSSSLDYSSPGNSSSTSEETSSMVSSFMMMEEGEEPPQHKNNSRNSDDDGEADDGRRTNTAGNPRLDPDDFTYRPIQVSDRDRIKELHEDWFPVTYQNEFYNDLAEGHLAGSPLFTSLAVYKKPRPQHDTCCEDAPIEPRNLASVFDSTSATAAAFEEGDDDSVAPPTESIDVVGSLFSTTFEMDEETGLIEAADCNHDEDDEDEPSIQLLDYHFDEDEIVHGQSSSLEMDEQQQQQQQQQSEEEEIIAGCVVGSFMPVTRIPVPLQSLLVSNPLKHGRLFYIMTLGAATEFRHAGLGTRLVQQCMDQVQQDPRCGTLYLHVITHNAGAIRLYEKLGFYRVQEIPDYYDIRGRKYPCYLYAKYFHGNPGHRDVYKFLAQCVWSFVRHVLELAHLSPTLVLLGNGGGGAGGSGDTGGDYNAEL